MTDVSKQIGVGRPSFLTEQQKQKIYDTALGILANVGMKVLHEEGQAVMLEGGCSLDEDGLIRVPADVVGWARAMAPASFLVYDRAGEPAMELGGRNSYYGNGSDLMHLFDLETGERRLGKLEDVSVAARLCDALPNIDFVMSGAWPDGMDAGETYPRQFNIMIKNTTKPLVMTAGGVETVEPMWRMACEVRGGPDELRAKPYFVMYNQPVSPLKHPFETVDKLLFCADHGIPSTYCPSPVAGGTAPITAAGQVTLGIAEALFGLVMHQLRAPGAAFVIGQGPNTLDMATAQSSYNSPEFVRAYACEVEMAKWLNLPNWGFSGHTDAQVVDAQAGMEADELVKLSMQLGSNLNHDCGYMDFGLTGSLEELVMVDEFIARNRRLLAAIEVSQETLAVDVLVKVGPGGDFLGQKHTKTHLRANQWRAQLLNRASHDRWAGAGALDLTQKAGVKARELLATHEVPALPDDLVARVDAVIAGL
ncbi:MAG TPA: trimethylamine methyltransferase family protein [Thermoleophilia bacterium]|nr:trimethylamine methyltransferase family protein [Thermoleophilia bacterium]